MTVWLKKKKKSAEAGKFAVKNVGDNPQISKQQKIKMSASVKHT